MGGPRPAWWGVFGSDALRTIAVVAVVLAAGCSAITSGGVVVSSDPVAVDPEAASAAELSVVGEDSFRVEEPVGDGRSVEATAHLVHLEGAAPTPVARRVVVLSVPTLEVLGREVDVAERVGPLSLVERGAGAVEAVERDRKLRTIRQPILGAERAVEVYAGTTREAGGSAEVEVYLARFVHDGDAIVAVGLAPRGDEAGQAAIRRALGGIEHG